MDKPTGYRKVHIQGMIVLLVDHDKVHKQEPQHKWLYTIFIQYFSKEQEQEILKDYTLEIY